MNDHVYKTVELTGTSTQGLQDAIQNAIDRAAQTLHHLRWFEVTKVRGDIDEQQIQYWQVTLKVSFTIDD